MIIVYEHMENETLKLSIEESQLSYSIEETANQNHYIFRADCQEIDTENITEQLQTQCNPDLEIHHISTDRV